MKIYVYSDESGVFDYKHNDYFVFGGLVFLSNDDRETCIRKYLNAEGTIRKTSKKHYNSQLEVKATNISKKAKSKLFRSLNQYIKFGVIVHQKRIRQEIWLQKKSKQRYLDYAFKIALKRCLEALIKEKRIISTEVEELIVNVDQHPTATDGKYELAAALENEFKYGTFNWNYDKYFEPLFPSLKSVNCNHCNSKANTLIRSADIVANRIYYLAREFQGCAYSIKDKDFYITQLP